MINIPKIFKDDKSDQPKQKLPLLPLRDIVVFPHMVALRDIVVFPHMVAPLFVGRTKSINAFVYAMNKDKNIFLASQKKAGIDSPRQKDINSIGVFGKVLQLLKLPDGTVKALVEGKSRGCIKRFIQDKDFFSVEVEPVVELKIEVTEGVALSRAVIESFEEYSNLTKNISKELVSNIAAISNPSQLADTAVAHFSFKIEDKQRLLETFSSGKRLSILLSLIKMEIDIFNMDKRIKSRVKEQMEKTQKSYYLNEQMRAIRKEMGSEENPSDELKELEKQIKRKKMSKEAAAKARQELRKLKMMTPMSAEATVVRNYIEWMISLPWFDRSKVRNNLDEAEKILNEDHYGLKKPKERILEYLAVQSLVKKVRGPILCFVGPPGVGKTSLATSVARATGRKFIRLSLGGVRDEAEIRGHRRTYIGAMPGKIIQSLKKIGVNNPVFCLDEVDKMSMDFRGDPSAALLEVLDPEQNFSFNDHYLDVDYDLTDILFITTANTLPEIPLPLQDRMEIIRLAGYTEFNIAFSKNSVYSIIRLYTREAGVRNLEREIASICRKISRKVVKNKDKNTFNITEKSLQKYLGPPRFKHSQVEEKDQIGIVTGLAWTQVGGELLCIETLIMPGKGELIMTGKLGDVMKESAQAAVDGPSAGISICTSIVSALTKRPVYRDIAMTGEITLRGRILTIGGLKEKILAAHRGGIKKVIIPTENEKDIKEIPSIILKQIDIVLVEHMDDVLSHALIVNEEDTLLKKDDISFEMMPEPKNIEHGAAII